MAPRSSEDFKKLETEIASLKGQLLENKKKSERFDKAEEQSLNLMEEVENLKKANKQLTKSGAVASGSDPTFDINLLAKLGEGIPKHLFTSRYSSKDYDMIYSFCGSGKDTPTSLLVQYRDNKFNGSQIS